MMTPEEIQRTMEFILSSHADSAIRMDRLKERLDQVRANNAEEHDQFRESLREQKERLEILLDASHDLLRVSRIHNERLKRLESKGKK